MKALGAVVAIIFILGLGIAVPVSAQWSEPINVGPPINSATQELRPSLTPFSDMMVLRTGRGSSSGLFTSHFINGQWSELQYVPSIGNPSSWIGPALSPDGNEIYFSCLCGGYGDYDIWKVVYDSISGTWSDPINLGPDVNDWGGQSAPFLSYNGQNLYFIDHSIRFEGLVVSHREGDSWSYPEWTHTYFATAEDASLTVDEQIIYFTKWLPDEQIVVFYSEKDEFGNWNPPQRFDIINNFGMGIYPRVNADGSRIYFSSDMAGGAGGYDIWFVESTTLIDEEEYDTRSEFISIFPNPSNSYFNISIEGYNEFGFMEIYDILGRQLSRVFIRPGDNTFRWPNQDADIGTISTGIYFARFINRQGDLRESKKLMLIK